jgi:NTP pyrophosphatase (non-canonical NTP hydrolase)
MFMSQQIDLNRYTEFVSVVTSAESNDTEALINRMRELDKDTNVALLTTAAIGLASEGGEFNEIVKKMLFQGKPFNQDNRFHLMRELGDIIWYWTNACRALGYDPNEVVAENVRKLESRYPGGTFNSWYSENRMDGDI